MDRFSTCQSKSKRLHPSQQPCTPLVGLCVPAAWSGHCNRNHRRGPLRSIFKHSRPFLFPKKSRTLSGPQDAEWCSHARCHRQRPQTSQHKQHDWGSGMTSPRIAMVECIYRKFAQQSVTACFKEQANLPERSTDNLYEQAWASGIDNLKLNVAATLRLHSLPGGAACRAHTPILDACFCCHV